MKKAKLLWIDLEMTGLVPGEDKILEVGVIATDWQLNEIDKWSGVVKVPEELMKSRMVGEFWEKNAESRQALFEQNANGEVIEVIEEELLKFVAKNFGSNSDTKIILAGNSIHQDRKFIDIEMPKLAKKLHYRMLDVSAWKLYFEEFLGKKFLKREAHRAVDDIEGSIEEFKYYLGFIK